MLGHGARAVVLASAAASALAACTVILGDGYSVTGATTGGSGGSGTGGHGGNTGGGGSSGVVPFECSWDPTRFRVLKDLVAEPAGNKLFDGDLFAVIANNEIRAITRRNGPNGNQIEVYSPDGGGQIHTFSRAVDRLFDVQTFPGGGTGIYYGQPVAGVPQFATGLFIVAENDADGANVTNLSVSTQPNTDTVDRGLFVPMSGGGAHDIAFLIQAVDATGPKTMLGRFTGSAVTPAQFTTYDATLPDNAFKPNALVRNGAATHAFLGEVSGQTPGRQYVLPDGSITPVPATTTYPIEYYPFAVSPAQGGGFDIAAAYLSTDGSGTLRLHAGTVDAAGLATLDLATLPAAVTFTSFADVPSNGRPHWFGPNMLMVGTSVTDKTTIRILILHDSGVSRTNQPVPFPTTPTAVSIDSVAAVANPSFNSLGGDVFVTWIERYVVGGVPHSVLQSGLMLCFPP